MSAKSMYINYLIDATTVMTSMNNNPDPGYLTYFTTNGIVVGREEVIDPIEYDNAKGFEEGIVTRLNEESSVSSVLIASSLYNHEAKDNQSDNNNDLQIIVLKDAQVLTAQNVVINCAQFVLFTDQVVGVVPGKFDLNQVKAR